MTVVNFIVHTEEGGGGDNGDGDNGDSNTGLLVGIIAVSVLYVLTVAAIAGFTLYKRRK